MNTDDSRYFVVRPVAGALVRDPHTHRALAAGGERKPKTGYWLRRLADGSAELVPPAAPAAPAVAVPEKAIRKEGAK